MNNQREHYEAIATEAALRHGLPPGVLLAQINQESGFNPKAHSPAGAQGIAQIMPATAKGWHVNPSDPIASIEAMAKNMGSYFRTYGNIDLALAAYNAGPGNVHKYGGIPPFAETQNYVKNILSASGMSPSAQTSGNSPTSTPPEVSIPKILMDKIKDVKLPPNPYGVDFNGRNPYINFPSTPQVSTDLSGLYAAANAHAPQPTIAPYKSSAPQINAMATKALAYQPTPIPVTPPQPNPLQNAGAAFLNNASLHTLDFPVRPGLDSTLGSIAGGVAVPFIGAGAGLALGAAPEIAIPAGLGIGGFLSGASRQMREQYNNTGNAFHNPTATAIEGLGTGALNLIPGSQAEGLAARLGANALRFGAAGAGVDAATHLATNGNVDLNQTLQAGLENAGFGAAAGLLHGHGTKAPEVEIPKALQTAEVEAAIQPTSTEPSPIIDPTQPIPSSEPLILPNEAAPSGQLVNPQGRPFLNVDTENGPISTLGRLPKPEILNPTPEMVPQGINEGGVDLLGGQPTPDPAMLQKAPLFEPTKPASESANVLDNSLGLQDDLLSQHEAAVLAAQDAENNVIKTAGNADIIESQKELGNRINRLYELQDKTGGLSEKKTRELNHYDGLLQDLHKTRENALGLRNKLDASAPISRDILPPSQAPRSIDSLPEQAPSQGGTPIHTAESLGYQKADALLADDPKFSLTKYQKDLDKAQRKTIRDGQKASNRTKVSRNTFDPSTGLLDASELTRAKSGEGITIPNKEIPRSLEDLTVPESYKNVASNNQVVPDAHTEELGHNVGVSTPELKQASNTPAKVQEGLYQEGNPNHHLTLDTIPTEHINRLGGPLKSVAVSDGAGGLKDLPVNVSPKKVLRLAEKSISTGKPLLDYGYHGEGNTSTIGTKEKLFVSHIDTSGRGLTIVGRNANGDPAQYFVSNWKDSKFPSGITSNPKLSEHVEQVKIRTEGERSSKLSSANADITKSVFDRLAKKFPDSPEVKRAYNSFLNSNDSVEGYSTAARNLETMQRNGKLGPAISEVKQELNIPERKGTVCE